MSSSKWIISCAGAQTMLFYTTLTGVDLAQYEIFCAEV